MFVWGGCSEKTKAGTYFTCCCDLLYVIDSLVMDWNHIEKWWLTLSEANTYTDGCQNQAEGWDNNQQNWFDTKSHKHPTQSVPTPPSAEVTCSSWIVDWKGSGGVPDGGWPSMVVGRHLQIILRIGCQTPNGVPGLRLEVVGHWKILYKISLR